MVAPRLPITGTRSVALEPYVDTRDRFEGATLEIVVMYASRPIGRG